MQIDHSYQGFALVMFFLTGVGLFISLVLWIIQGFAYYNMGVKAKYAYPWLAFIPIANLWLYMAIIKRSAWNILWILVPIANIIFAVIWTVRLFKAFNMSPHWAWLLLGSIIPVIGWIFGLAIFILICYIGFSSNVRYNPEFVN
jgi:hypothetical protein